MDTLINSKLELRSKLVGNQYSEIISSLFWIYFCGGDCIEDIGTHLGSELKHRPDTRIPSSNTLLCWLKELAVDNTLYTADSGTSYAFNTAKN